MLFALRKIVAISIAMQIVRAVKLSVSGRQLFGEWASCSSSAGLCINADAYSCSNPVVSGQCPGGSNILCCQAPAGIPYGTCISSHNGLCMRSLDCGVSTISGLCPGPSGIVCCPGAAGGTLPPPVGDVPVTPGIYLESNPPTMQQFRPRRASVRPVIVVHTAETGGTAGPPDGRAEGTANFIRTRSEFGSYHLVGDTDSIIQLVRFENTAYHDGTGSNDWSVGISLAMRADDWPGLDSVTRTRLVNTAAQMAGMAAEWMQTQGVGKPAPVRLSKIESDANGASGFIAHGDRDPGRRTDPGASFPWTEFLAAYDNRT